MPLDPVAIAAASQGVREARAALHAAAAARRDALLKNKPCAHLLPAIAQARATLRARHAQLAAARTPPAPVQS